MDRAIEAEIDWTHLKLSAELQILNFGPWTVITRRTIDLNPFDHKPCISMMVFLNEKSQLYSLHILNRTFHEGPIEGLEHVNEIVQDFFQNQHPCHGHFKNLNSAKSPCNILVGRENELCANCQGTIDELNINDETDLMNTEPADSMMPPLKSSTANNTLLNNLLKEELSETLAINNEPSDDELSLIPDILGSTSLFQDIISTRISDESNNVNYSSSHKDNNVSQDKNSDSIETSHPASGKRKKLVKRNGEVRCSHCDEELCGTKALRRHLRTAHGLSLEDISVLAGKYQCSICHKDFSSESRREWHNQRAHLAGDWQCLHCPQAARFGSEILRHYKTHHQPKQSQIKCPLCEVELCFKTGFDKVVGAHWASCLSREKAQRTKLKGTIDTKHMCEECGRVFSCQKILKEHQDKHRGIYRHKCKDCNFKTTSLDLLKSHWGNIHALTAKKFQEKNYVPCQICGKIVVDTYLQMHIDNKHSDPAWPCDQCDKGFGTKAILQKHKESKHFIRTVKCCECGLLVKSVSLWGHMKRHSPPKYCCRFCGKGLKTKVSLANHERLHTGENPYKCDSCPFTFATSGNLLRHKKSQHNLEKVNFYMPAEGPPEEDFSN